MLQYNYDVVQRLRSNHVSSMLLYLHDFQMLNDSLCWIVYNRSHVSSSLGRTRRQYMDICNIVQHSDVITICS